MDITNKINGINKNINETFENFFYDETRSLKNLFDERMED